MGWEDWEGAGTGPYFNSSYSSDSPDKDIEMSIGFMSLFTFLGIMFVVSVPQSWALVVPVVLPLDALFVAILIGALRQRKKDREGK